jgi:hypothetical protein
LEIKCIEKVEEVLANRQTSGDRREENVQIKQRISIKCGSSDYKLHEKKKSKDIPWGFYYSKNKMVSIEKSTYLSNTKCRDTLCSREQKFVQESGKHLVMLIGDRGYGYGSRITGFNRYGGKWKHKIHGKYTTVAITNEYKT